MSTPRHKRCLPLTLTVPVVAELDALAIAHNVSRHALMVAALTLGLAQLSKHPEALKAALPDVWTSKKPSAPLKLVVDLPDPNGKRRPPSSDPIT